MQSTIATRLQLTRSRAQLLDEMAGLYGSLKRELYACIAARGGNAKSHRTDFCRTHGILSHMFNAMAVDMQGSIDSTRELLKEEKKQLHKVIARREKQQRERYEELLDLAETLYGTVGHAKRSCASAFTTATRHVGPTPGGALRCAIGGGGVGEG